MRLGVLREEIRNPLSVFGLDFRHDDDFVLDLTGDRWGVIELAVVESVLERSPGVGGGVVLVPYIGRFDVQNGAKGKD